MHRQTDKQALNRHIRQSSKPAAVCGRQSLQDELGPAEAAISLAPEECSTDETEATIFALALAVEQRDRHTAAHCERLAFISVALGMALRLSRADLMALYRGSFLHDVGKVGIPDSILFKPGNLNAEEWVIMRSHAARGEEICRHMKLLTPVLPIIRHHHERWDGGGYPDGLRMDQIPLLARLVQIADIYDALTSPRSYKPAFSPDKALRIIAEETSLGWRDPEIVDLFQQVHKGIITKIAYHEIGADSSLTALRNSLTDLRALMAAVA
ncbi:MAG TPA: HD domain-containing phosphohydrolase [Candidatus Acidoferrales bacterium]|jgi:putative nucleotidyltransferase with HDIG domain|nr:HD domain-containing phosphohydrolase [Candidatus Acidoferrales bacterium]